MLRVFGGRAFRRSICVGGGGLVLGFALAAAVSCLPDLTPVAIRPVIEVGPPPGPFCGDGLIDPDAGEQCDPGSSDAGTSTCSTLCAVVCNGGLIDEVSGHCYFTPDAGAQPYEMAKSTCMSAGGHVVSFASPDELQKVAGWYQDAGSRFWVGLSLDPSSNAYKTQLTKEPGWAGMNRCAGCYAHVEADAQAFAGATTLPGAAACVVGTTALAEPWSQSLCTVLLPKEKPATICEREPSGTYAQPCIGGTCVVVPSTMATKRYLYVASRESAAQAQSSCKANGGTLVVLTSREEREQLARELARLVPSAPTPALWIGLTRPSGGAWVWEDTHAITDYPLPWADREPKLPGKNAFSYIDLSEGLYDTQLARSDDGTQLLTYLCEFPRL